MSDQSDSLDKTGIYYDLCASGLPITSHYSDLYVPVTPVSTEILAKYPLCKKNARPFIRAGQMCYDIPYAYAPYWEQRQAISESVEAARRACEERDPQFRRAGCQDCLDPLLLGKRPEADPLECTSFACWSKSGDSRTAAYHWRDPRSIVIIRTVLTNWSKSLGIPSILPGKNFEALCLEMGKDVFLRGVIAKIVDEGYAVWASDESIEIFDPASIRDADAEEDVGDEGGFAAPGM